MPTVEPVDGRGSAVSRSPPLEPGRENLLGLDSGLEALRASDSFLGPVESLDGHETNDHLALIYESHEELFETAVPFIAQGLADGERCMYVADDSSRSAVLGALRAGGVDVDEALSSGALTVHTKQDTYMRDGSFDPDDMIAFLSDAIADAEREHDALRIAGEMTWILGEDPELDALIEYEGKLNGLFPEENCIALCQYNRHRFPPAVIRDVIRTHPHLVYDSTVCHNVYYTPPEEFFGPEQPSREIDRMMRTLVERTEAKVELEERERYLRRQNEITGQPDRSFEEKLHGLLELGCERFGMELGAVARVDPTADRFVVEYVTDDHAHFAPGVELDLSETYCSAVAGTGGPGSVVDPEGEGFGDVTVREEFGIETYLGTHVEIEGDLDRTLFFVSSEPRDEPFTDEEHTFHRLMGQWVKYELDHRQREQSLNDLYETAADPEHTFETKVRALLELGRERFGMECGAFSRIADGKFETIEAVGDHPRLQPAESSPVSETYCRKLLDRDDPLALDHASEQGWEDDVAYEVWEFESYVGTTVSVGNEPYGTLCFAADPPRSRPFTEDEKTFLELTSQWVSYELEREHREVQLAALNEMARDLMNGETEAAIAETTVEHADARLGLPSVAVVSFDRETGQLSPIARTPRATDCLPLTALCDRETGPFWDAFVANEVRVADDAGDMSGAGDDVTGAIAVPLGTRGLLVVGTSDRGGVCPAEREFVEAVAATVETATVRAERERELQEREAALEAQNETLERLDRVNDIIRSIDQALVQAATREEIVAVVCEQLATVGPYELAWVGEHDPVTAEVTPIESAGTEKGYLDGLAISTDDGHGSDGPTARAVRTREPQVANDILSDETCVSWRQEALNRGYHAAVSLPLIYQDRCYGVLNLYAGQSDVFDELERSVLTEMSETIAYAINAVESKKALVSEEATVLQFTVEDDALSIVRTASETGCRLSVDRVTSRSDGQLRAYFTTSGVPADDVLALESILPLSDIDLIAHRDADGERVSHFEATAGEESLAATVHEHGGRLREATVDDGVATVAVELAADAAVREFVEMFQTRFPDSTLVAQRTDERTAPSGVEFRETFTEELTPRQHEALQAAYFNGFFEQPRPRTGSDIADSMDISQPTFNAHLRSAQRKLCQRLFESGGT